MPGTTTRLALPYAVPDDTTDVPRDIKALAEKLDLVVVVPDPGDLKFSARVNEHGAWVKADGRILTSGMFPALRAALIADGSPYGAVSGSPKLPDLRGRLPVGAGAGPGLTARTAGQQGGEERHTLTEAELAAHSHGLGAYSVQHSIPAGWHQDGESVTQYNLASTGTMDAGSSTPHENMPPFTVGQWFIYAGG